MNPWLVFGLTLAFNAGILWATVHLVSRKAERLSKAVDGLTLTVAKLDASMDARHEENLRRFERLEG